MKILDKKISQALNGIKSYRPKKSESLFSFKNISTGNFQPPAYVMAVILFHNLKCEDYGPEEKVSWHTYVQYKGCVFKIRDYKFGSWSVEAKSINAITRQFGEQLIKKIQSASYNVDKVMQKIVRKAIDDDFFYINNNFYKLNSAFKFYLREAKRSLLLYQKYDKKSKRFKDAMRLTEAYNELLKQEKILSYRMLPLIISFYSMLEFFLDAFYAFERPQINFGEYKNCTWQERFKKVISLENQKILASYNDIVRIWKKYRIPLSHGLYSSSTLLVPFPSAGLIPISYEHLSDTMQFGFMSISFDDSQDIIKVLSDFFSIFREGQYQYYLMYLERGFSVPNVEEEVKSIKSKMVSKRQFKQYLIEKERQQEEILNMNM